MRDASLDRVMDAIQTAADEAGFLAANIDQFCDATGYSRATIKRALIELAATGEIIAEPKRGPGGGLRIQLKKGSEKGSEAEPNLSPIAERAMPFENFGSGGLRPLEPEPNSLAPDAEPNSDPYSEPWFRGPWAMPAELPPDVRKRGAQFFRELRLGLLPNKPKGPNNKILNELEPLPKAPA